MPEASRTPLTNRVLSIGAATVAAVWLGLVAWPNAARAQGVYVPDDSRIQSVDPGNPSPNADNPTVKSLGTIPIAPGGEPTHPYISEDDIDGRGQGEGLEANHVAYGEAAANAYKTKNFSEARTLWEQAAKNGEIDALYALGVMCERGEGGPKDLEQALGWYYAAEQRGVRQASAKVAAITEQLRQEAIAGEAANKAAESAQAAAQAAADKKAAQNAAKADAAKAAAAKAEAAKAAAAKAAAAKAKEKEQAEAPPPSPPPQVTRAPESPAPKPQDAVEQPTVAAVPAPQTQAAAEPTAPAKPTAPTVPQPTPPQAGRPPTQLQPKPSDETAAADPNAMRFSPAHNDSDIPAEDAFARATAAAAGRGVKKDDGEAAKWFRVAADKGYAPAQNDLAFFYAEGRGVKKNDAEAVKWYQRAADQNYPPAQTSLGMMYAAGRGVKQSDFEALALYSSAANQGYAPAMANLAQAYADGRGIKKDERTAQFLMSSVNEKPRKGSGIYVDSGS